MYLLACLAGVGFLATPSLAVPSTAKSCIGPESKEISMMERLLIQKEFCVHMTLHNEQLPPTVDVTVTFGGQTFATETLNQRVEHMEDKCHSLVAKDGCKICVGFESIEIADDWATICPKAILKCPGVARDTIIPMPCGEMGNEDMDEVAEITYGLTAFGFDLLNSVALTATADAFVAPFSMANTLMVTMLASDGESRDQIHNALHLEDHIDHRAVAESYGALLGGLQHEDALVLSYVDSTLWFGDDYWNKVNPDFKESSKEFVSIRRLDFSKGADAAVEAINDNVDQGTRGHITDAVSDSVGSHTVMVFTNCMYFASKFEIPFTHTNKIAYHDPHKKGGPWENTVVEMMYTQKKVEFNVAHTTEAEIIELPMQGEFSDFVTYILRPKDDTAKDTISLEKHLQEMVFEDALKTMKPKQMQVALPVMEMYYVEDMTAQLQKLGIVDVMDPNKSDMRPLFKNTTRLNAYDDAFDRKGWIKFSTFGIEAAAYSGDGMGRARDKDQSGKVAHADKPFLFLIMDRGSNTLMFAGRITNPNGWYMKDDDVQPSSHVGTVIFIVLLLCSLAYCGVMYGYNVSYHGMSGTEAIPHRDCMVSCFLSSISLCQKMYEIGSEFVMGLCNRAGGGSASSDEPAYAPMEDALGSAGL